MTPLKFTVPLACFGAALVLMGAVGFASGSTSSPKCSFRDGGVLPDKTCTPGAVALGFTKARLCSGRLPARPPLSWSEPHKFASMRDYGIETSPGHAGLYEYDHLIPLELGGAPMDPRNLWPEPHATSYAKDKTENRLKREVCAGKISLRAARHEIRTDWRTAP